MIEIIKDNFKRKCLVDSDVKDAGLVFVKYKKAYKYLDTGINEWILIVRANLLSEDLDYRQLLIIFE